MQISRIQQIRGQFGNNANAELRKIIGFKLEQTGRAFIHIHDNSIPGVWDEEIYICVIAVYSLDQTIV
jgi:hypothetical protein